MLEKDAKWEIIEGEAMKTLVAMPTASVDAVITDPPYSSGGAFRGDRIQTPAQKYIRSAEHADFGGDSRDQRSFLLWCTLWLSECLRIAKPKSPICLFTDWRQLPIMTDALQAGGWVWRGILPWDKGVARNVPWRRWFANQCEYVIWGTSGSIELAVEGEKFAKLTGSIRHGIELQKKEHMTGKPVPVMQHLVRIAKPDGIVLDPFCGSASTGVASLREGRRFIGIEMGADYAETSRARLKRWHLDLPEFEGIVKSLKPKMAKGRKR
ncbi:MAG: DNA methyltransferase [Vulcanimicrobiaceae bacterium]